MEFIVGLLSAFALLLILLLMVTPFQIYDIETNLFEIIFTLGFIGIILLIVYYGFIFIGAVIIGAFS